MRHFALSAVGRDRPGIVAATSGVLLRHAVNVEDSQMTILGGHFTMMLIVSAPDEVDEAALASELAVVADELGLGGLHLGEVTESSGEGAEATHIVSIYGVDHPGIVHAVAAALAGRGVNITDLATRLVTREVSQPLYAMMLEVALGPGHDPEEVARALRAVGAEQGVEVSFRALERDEL